MMKLYSNKQKWKIILLVVAIILIGISLFVSNEIVNKVAERERERVTQWADAIKKRAELIEFTNQSFDQLREKELAEMQLWILATKEVSKSTNINGHQSYELPLSIIQGNNDIPVIVLDQDKNISTYINLGFEPQDLARHQNIAENDPKLQELFNDTLLKLTESWVINNAPFTIEIYKGMFMTYYFTDSKDIIRLETERDSLIQSFNKELIENPDLVPVILTDESKENVIATNISGGLSHEEFKAKIEALEKENQPIVLQFSHNKDNYLFYASSPELLQLQLFPYIQFLLIGLFIFIGYIIFSTFRKAEQNQVWAGMAKETAHQLGTPLSSLMAWIELLKSMDLDPSITLEMTKDVNRLTQITDRFSKIGAATVLKSEDIIKTTKELLRYLKTRSPKDVDIKFQSEEEELLVPHNPALFEWVIENICKNAIDAMEGRGELRVEVSRKFNKVYIDIKDNGKGMTNAMKKSVFRPGFTTKTRGWGLGLSLAKRIIETNHKGKVFVLHSEIDKGTTFRVVLYI